MTSTSNTGLLVIAQWVSIWNLSPLTLSPSFHAFFPHLVELYSLFVAHAFPPLFFVFYSERSAEGEAEQGQCDFGLAGSRETQRSDSGVWGHLLWEGERDAHTAHFLKRHSTNYTHGDQFTGYVGFVTESLCYKLEEWNNFDLEGIRFLAES